MSFSIRSAIPAFRVVAPRARAAGDTTVTRPAAPVAPGDALQVTPSLGNARFAGAAALEQLARGGAAPAAGDKEAITAVQNALGAMGFYLSAGANGQLDVGFANALKNFQAAAGLPKTGKLDRTTLQQLDQFAPPPGKTAWDPGVKQSLIPDPVVRDANGKPYMVTGADGKPKPMIARVVAGIGQHRVFSFDAAGNLVKIYPCRTGKNQPRGNVTMPAVKVVDAKLSGQALRDVGARLWNAPNAFGEALLALSKIDPATGKKVPFAYNGQELHGVPNPTGLGTDYSHGCVGVKNADIKEIAGSIRAGDIVRFDP